MEEGCTAERMPEEEGGCMLILRLKRSLIVAVLLWTLSATFVTAGNHGRDNSKESEWDVDLPTLSDLDLSAEQKQKIRALNEAFHEDIEPLRARELKVRSELHSLWMQADPDVGQIKAKEKEIHDLRWQMKQRFIDYHLSFRNLLSPDQLRQYLSQAPYSHPGRHRK